MYDLEILVPAEANLQKRFEDFKRWGLQNIGDCKIKLVLAASKGNDIAIFKSGWPEGIDVEILETPYKHVAQRIYYYYDNLKPDAAKWYLRIDEDSLNDISGLMNHLNDLFDYTREYHIVGEINYDIQQLEKDLLCEIGFSHWYGKSNEGPPHEHEASITSLAAMKRILECDKAKEYLKLRKQIPNGYGDHGLCFCARMVKIHPISAKFLTINPDIINFSIFGGRYNHIHWVSREKNPGIIQWLETKDEQKSKLFENQSFLLCNEKEKEKRWIRLAPNYNVENVSVSGHRELYAMWGVNKDEQIMLFHQEWRDQNEKNPLLVFEANSGSDIITYTNKILPDIKLKTGSLSAITELMFDN